MKRLIVESWTLLVFAGFIMRFRGLDALYQTIRTQHVRSVPARTRPTLEMLCRFMDLACVFYPTRVMCLQRSAATTLLLRRHGRIAEMIIGAQVLPLMSHAWVEIDGTVVNDKPYMRDIYRVLERC
jgi:hypothetical protein